MNLTAISGSCLKTEN